MNEIKQIPLDHITPHRNNRQYGGMEQAKLDELADSIATHGVIEPIIVRPLTDDSFELVAGERRWRAATIAGLQNIPSIARDLDDEAAVKIRTIENLQREDLHPLDELSNYEELIETCGYSAGQISVEIGRSRSYVLRRLSLRNLDDEPRRMLLEGEIQLSHAMVISRLPATRQAESLQYVLNYDDTLKSVAAFREDIERNVICSLNNAPWPLDWGDPEKNILKCSLCPERAKNSGSLFPELGADEDRCLDPQCFARKRIAWIEEKREELQHAKGGFYDLQGDYSSTEAFPKALDRFDYKEVEEGTEGAVVGIMISGPRAGEIIPVLTGASLSLAQDAELADKQDPEEQEKRRLERKEWDIERRTRDKVIEVVREELVKTIGVLPRKASEAVVLTALLQIDISEYKAVHPGDCNVFGYLPTFEFAADENGNKRYGEDPHKMVEWIASLTKKEIEPLAAECLAILVVDDAYDDDRIQAACELAELNTESVLEVSREEAEAEWEAEDARIKEENATS